MSQTRIPISLWTGFLLALTAALLLIGKDAFNRYQRLQLANAGAHYYSEALQTADNRQRKALLNQALEYYLLLAQGGSPSSALNETIGDITQQLGELPWSALYYLRAANASKAKGVFERLGQPVPTTISSFRKMALVLTPEVLQTLSGAFPILPGTTVEVLEVYPAHGKLRVKTPDGREGYIDMGSAAWIPQDSSLISWPGL